MSSRRTRPILVPTVRRGNAVLAALRPSEKPTPEPTTRSVEDGIPTETVGTRAFGNSTQFQLPEAVGMGEECPKNHQG